MKILVLTAEYPNKYSQFDTPVVHYYTKEWAALGHSVKVIHYRSVFPSFFYLFAKLFKGVVKKFFGTDFIPAKKLKRSEYSELDGVKVVIRPIFKVFPHIRFFPNTINKHILKIINENVIDDFYPDIVIGHFLNPQLEILYKIKFHYKGIKTVLVLHENPRVIKKIFKSASKKMLDSIDYIGFRFPDMMKIFVDIFEKSNNLFICPSGIPEKFILREVPEIRHRSNVLRVVFVGMLIPLKNVDIILKSLAKTLKNEEFHFTIIGEGMLKSRLKKLSLDLGISNKVEFLDKISREEVQQKLMESDIFIMVSEPEAFGLVYLEAMSKGCIAIGTIGQGIDGIIKNGINGFLCKSRDIISLSETLEAILKMDYNKRLQISQSALETAQKYTDRLVAKNYLDTLIGNS